MNLGIYKINEIIYEGEVDSITLPGSEGDLTLLKDHAPIITYLKKGEILIKSGYKKQTIKIDKGVLHLDGRNNIQVLLD